MKLIDLLSVLDKFKNVVVNYCGDAVTFYDGRNSIDKRYNDCEVMNVSAEDDAIIIEIDMED